MRRATVKDAMNGLGRIVRHRGVRWSHVADLFSVGSTNARQMCRDAELDPDEMIGRECAECVERETEEELS